jgi:hypothetical protein
VKIVDRKTFLAMPPETVFAKYAPCYMEDLQIKGDSLNSNDYFYQNIADAVDARHSDEFADMLHTSAETGCSIPMNFDVQGRDGCFDEGQLFAVFEPQDVEALIARLHRCVPPSTPKQGEGE